MISSSPKVWGSILGNVIPPQLPWAIRRCSRKVRLLGNVRAVSDIWKLKTKLQRAATTISFITPTWKSLHSGGDRCLFPYAGRRQQMLHLMRPTTPQQWFRKCCQNLSPRVCGQTLFNLEISLPFMLFVPKV